MPPSTYCDSLWLVWVRKKPSIKADLVIHSYIDTVSGEYLSVAIMLAIRFQLLCNFRDSFCKSSVHTYIGL